MKYTLRTFLPKDLFWRTVIIFAVPLIVVQLVVGLFFYDRLFQKATAGRTGELIQQIKLATRSEPRIAQELGFDLRRLDAAPSPRPNLYDWQDFTAPQVINTLNTAFPRIYYIDLQTQNGWVVLAFHDNGADFTVRFARNRASERNPHQLLVAMILSSIIMAGIAAVFLKNQIRPIRVLARVVESFGKGRVVPFQPRGADEIRKVGVALQAMIADIEERKEQRILMLSGVSHDLRTPLTRMKLSLSMAGDNAELDDIKQDIADMEGIIQEFLDFARGDATENRERVDAVALAARLIDIHKRAGITVQMQQVTGNGEPIINLRQAAINRALSNLIDNAGNFAKVIHLGLELGKTGIVFRIEDDGPGIDPAEHADALRPFERLDRARNQNKSAGTGLGLAIAADIIRNHGGQLRLGKSERLGGLMVEVALPR